MTPAVRPATASDWPAAAARLCADAPDAGRAAAHFLQLLAEKYVDPAGLFVADGGAIFAYPMAGGQGVVWPPAGDEGVADALAAAAVAYLRAGGAKVLQTVTRPAERPRTEALERLGFRRVTELVFLTRETTPDDRGLPHAPLLFRPAGPSDEFADVLFRTYDGTRDCPELNGTRTAAETLDGYKPSDGSAPLWWLADRDGRAVGLVMLADRGVTCELVYAGLVPNCRGAGLGRPLVRFALAEAARRGHRYVILSADARNAPALAVYADFGFRLYDQRDVFLLLP